MDYEQFKFILGLICGAGGVLAGGAYWLGRTLSTVTNAIANLNLNVAGMTEAIKQIGNEFVKRDERIEALGRRHDEVRERVVILEHDHSRPRCPKED